MAHKKSEWDLFTISTGKKIVKSVDNKNVPGLNRTELDLIYLNKQLAKEIQEVWDKYE